MPLSQPEPRRWYKLEDEVAGAWDALIKALIMSPIVWFLKVYDNFWAAKMERKPDFQEIKRRVKGEIPRDAPVPLPRRRKRALSDPLPAPESIHSMSYGIRRARQRTEVQMTSLFLTKLPLEIRRMIYAEVLAGGERRSLVHILRKSGRLGHWRCRVQEEGGVCDLQMRRCIEGWLAYRTRFVFWDRVRRLDIITDGGLLPLLLTCRVIYTEAIPILYSHNTFHFYDPGDINFFARSILPQRLDTIQSLIMDWERPFSIFNMDNSIPKQDDAELLAWKQSWGVIANMQNLTYLRVVLKSHKFEVTPARRRRMCRLMMDIQGLKRFELIVPWNDGTNWGFAANAPFRVFRGPKIVFVKD